MPSLTIEEIKLYSNLDTKVFVESGTYEGETIRNVKDHFERIYSIELSPFYTQKAKNKYGGENHIQIIEGDTTVRMAQVCQLLKKPPFFWLDGHHSGGDTARGAKDSPVLEEIDQIVTTCIPTCVIVIDDVRLFNKKLDQDWTGITKEAILQKCLPRLYRLQYFSSSSAKDDRMVIELCPL